jgi:hypothetical protein
MSSTDVLKTQSLNREIGLLIVLALLSLLVVVWFYRYCHFITSIQAGRPSPQHIADVEKKTSEVLAVLMRHVVTSSDLLQADEKTRSDNFELIVARNSIKLSVTDLALTDEESCHEKDKSSTAIKRYLTGRATVNTEEYLSSAAVGTFNLPSCCSICLDDFVEGDLICWSKIPSCKHIFHQQCLLPWLLLHDSCPSCRCNIFANSESSFLSPSLP